MMRALADRKHPWSRKMVFARALSLSRARADEGLGHVPSDILAAQSAALLVLDDLGQETVGVDVIRDVIHHRHDCELPTIYTSHLDRQGIAGKYGAGTARRITERCARVEL
jgi:hypothetical protein